MNVLKAEVCFRRLVHTLTNDNARLDVRKLWKLLREDPNGGLKKESTTHREQIMKNYQDVLDLNFQKTIFVLLNSISVIFILII